MILGDDHDYTGDNMEEAEFGQLQAIHNNMNHIAAVQRKLAEQAQQPSLTHCEECGDEIPEKRQQLVKGVRLCVFCQQLQERNQGK